MMLNRQAFLQKFGDEVTSSISDPHFSTPAPRYNVPDPEQTRFNVSEPQTTRYNKPKPTHVSSLSSPDHISSNHSASHPPSHMRESSPPEDSPPPRRNAAPRTPDSSICSSAENTPEPIITNNIIPQKDAFSDFAANGTDFPTHVNDFGSSGNDFGSSGNDFNTSANDFTTSGNDFAASGNDFAASGNLGFGDDELYKESQHSNSVWSPKDKDDSALLWHQQEEHELQRRDVHQRGIGFSKAVTPTPQMRGSEGASRENTEALGSSAANLHITGSSAMNMEVRLRAVELAYEEEKKRGDERVMKNASLMQEKKTLTQANKELKRRMSHIMQVNQKQSLAHNNLENKYRQLQRSNVRLDDEKMKLLSNLEGAQKTIKELKGIIETKETEQEMSRKQHETYAKQMSELLNNLESERSRASESHDRDMRNRERIAWLENHLRIAEERTRELTKLQGQQHYQSANMKVHMPDGKNIGHTNNTDMAPKHEIQYTNPNQQHYQHPSNEKILPDHFQAPMLHPSQEKNYNVIPTMAGQPEAQQMFMKNKKVGYFVPIPVRRDEHIKPQPPNHTQAAWDTVPQQQQSSTNWPSMVANPVHMPQAFSPHEKDQVYAQVETNNVQQNPASNGPRNEYHEKVSSPELNVHTGRGTPPSPADYPSTPLSLQLQTDSQQADQQNGGNVHQLPPGFRPNPNRVAKPEEDMVNGDASGNVPGPPGFRANSGSPQYASGQMNRPPGL